MHNLFRLQTDKCTEYTGLQVVLGKEQNKEKPSGTGHVNMTLALAEKSE